MDGKMVKDVCVKFNYGKNKKAVLSQGNRALPLLIRIS